MPEFTSWEGGGKGVGDFTSGEARHGALCEITGDREVSRDFTFLSSPGQYRYTRTNAVWGSRP